MKVAIVGAGPSGALAATLISKKGHDVTLIDPLVPWEKPCGGGLTTRDLARFESLGVNLELQAVDKVSLSFGNDYSVDIVPSGSMGVVSRAHLGRALLSMAETAGTAFCRQRITLIQRHGGRWKLSGAKESVEADVVVGADGTTSFVRRKLGKPLTAADLAVTMGYFIPGTSSSLMKIFFVPGLQGYLWSFPRPDHLSYGLITRSEPGWNVRAKQLLENFITADLGREAFEHAEFYSAPVPCLRKSSWKANVISGPQWALIGDAAGLADPITGEGIFYALRSAELLADSIDNLGEYATRVHDDFGRDLARAARYYSRFYRGRFAGGDFRRRTLQLINRSRTVRTIANGMISGTYRYGDLRKRFLWASPSIAWELLRGGHKA